jgi:hypothetical protein
LCHQSDEAAKQNDSKSCLPSREVTKIYKVPISTTDHQIVQKDCSNAIHMGTVLGEEMKAIK